MVLGFLAYTFVNALTANNTGVVPGPIPHRGDRARRGQRPAAARPLHGWAFICTGGAIALLVTTIFLNLYPRVLVSSTNAAYSLTIVNSSASHYALTVITIISAIFVPIVVALPGVGVLGVPAADHARRVRAAEDPAEAPGAVQA